MASISHNSTMSSWTSQPPPPIPEGIIPATFPDDSGKIQGVSGLGYTWRLWRHCCCRFGWYPLIVAPIVTLATLLSLYSAGGCDFINLDVGFDPVNKGWNQSAAVIGLFAYDSGDVSSSGYQEKVFPGCQWYAGDFEAEFIEGDRTWKVARVMAYISGVGGVMATVTSWLFVFTPIPAFIFWPGVLLPALVTAFLAEGSKFLLFDAGICRRAVWEPGEEDELAARVAEQCALGLASYMTVASGGIFFVSLLFVCLHAPQKRELDLDFGVRTNLDHGESELDSPQGTGSLSLGFGGDRGQPDFDLSRIEHGYSIGDDRSFPQKQESDRTHPRIEERLSGADPIDYSDSVHGPLSTDYQHDDLVSERLRSLDGDNDPYDAQVFENIVGASHDNRRSPQKPHSEEETFEEISISESRLYAAERLEQSTTNTTSDALIERIVNEINDSFVVKPDPLGDKEELQSEGCADREQQCNETAELGT